MALLQEYYQPNSVDEALKLLNDAGGSRVPLAGGTWLVGQLETRALPHIEGVVDLRDAGLATLEEADGALTVGAMCTLTDFISHPSVRALADGVLVRAAHGEGPQNLLNAATIGGLVALAEYDCELYAALLALDAQVSVRDLKGIASMIPLTDFSTNAGLITEIRIQNDSYRGGLSRIARTPSDRPIVAAVAVERRHDQKNVRIALCGVSQRPVMKDSILRPPDDFKGSSDYRLAMASIVTERAVAELRGVDSHDN